MYLCIYVYIYINIYIYVCIYVYLHIIYTHRDHWRRERESGFQNFYSALVSRIKVDRPQWEEGFRLRRNFGQVILQKLFSTLDVLQGI